MVVGAGAVGASAAYHIASAGLGSVLVLEREPTPASGSTGRCAGGFRHQFSSRVNIALSKASIPLITSFTETHGLPLDVHQDGYLFLVRDAETWAGYARVVRLQQEMAVNVQLLDGAQAAEIVPGLRADDVVGATYCPEDGLVDPAGLTQGYLTAARRHGAELALRQPVERLLTSAGRVTGVSTPDGDVLAGWVVNAAGPWAAGIAGSAGVELPVEPLARTVVVTGPFPGRPAKRTLVVDAATGFYFHREAEGVLMGMGARGERTGFGQLPGEGFLAEELLPVAVSVLPALEDAAVAHRWIGYYEMTPDAHPILGPVPGLGGLLLANGFSGHGLQHAPVVGKLLAEWITSGEARSVDVSCLGLERFERGGLTAEARVI